MNFYLFSLNPYLLYESDEDMVNRYKNDIAQLKKRQKVVFRWSVQSYKMVDIGDKALFITLGTQDKSYNGLFGCGEILKPSFTDIKYIQEYEGTKNAKIDPSGKTITAEHWNYDKQGEYAHYCVIDVKCLSIPTQPIIPMYELESDVIFKLEKWSIRGTGYPIKNKSAAIKAYQRLTEYRLNAYKII